MKKSDKDLIAIIPERQGRRNLVKEIRTSGTVTYAMTMRHYMERFLAARDLIGDDIRTKRRERGPVIALPGGVILVAMPMRNCQYGYFNLDRIRYLEILPEEAGFRMDNGIFYCAEGTVRTLAERFQKAMKHKKE